MVIGGGGGSSLRRWWWYKRCDTNGLPWFDGISCRTNVMLPVKYRSQFIRQDLLEILRLQQRCVWYSVRIGNGGELGIIIQIVGKVHSSPAAAVCHNLTVVDIWCFIFSNQWDWNYYWILDLLSICLVVVATSLVNSLPWLLTAGSSPPPPPPLSSAVISGKLSCFPCRTYNRDQRLLVRRKRFITVSSSF